MTFYLEPRLSRTTLASRPLPSIANITQKSDILTVEFTAPILATGNFYCDFAGFGNNLYNGTNKLCSQDVNAPITTNRFLDFYLPDNFFNPFITSQALTPADWASASISINNLVAYVPSGEPYLHLDATYNNYEGTIAQINECDFLFQDFDFKTPAGIGANEVMTVDFLKSNSKKKFAFIAGYGLITLRNFNANTNVIISIK